MDLPMFVVLVCRRSAARQRTKVLAKRRTNIGMCLCVDVCDHYVVSKRRRSDRLGR